MPNTGSVKNVQDQEKPFLTVTAHVTPEHAEKAARHFRLLQSLKMIVAFSLFLLVLTAVLTLYHGLPLSAFGEVLKGSNIWVYIVIYAAFSFIYHVWYQPRQARRALVEAYGDAPSWEMYYTLDSQRLRIGSVGTKTTFESVILYTDIHRIRELRYQILLRTQKHQLLSINKLGMSSSDAAALLAGLKERAGHGARKN